VFKGDDDQHSTLDCDGSSSPVRERRGVHGMNTGGIILAPDSPMHGVLELARRVARTDCNVLVTGESGTGKEVVVREIHQWSTRNKGPFVPVNCGAIPEQLLESELFGHVRGAFTGADRNRVGRFELADGGTVFLDEIADLPGLLQVKLLRVIQERTVEPLGAPHPKLIDFRLVAATNTPLEEAVQKKAFREDLYFRLNVLRLHLPALRERPMDIPPLVVHFVSIYNDRYMTTISGFSESALNLLCTLQWAGNVRELENFVQGLMVVFGEGEITEEHVRTRLNELTQTGRKGLFRHEGAAGMGGMSMEFPEGGVNLTERLEAYESQLLDEAMRRSEGNKSKAARLLGLNRTTLVEKLKRKKA
jgi:transcriptional regulator with PAS, ATPase and Fis domain